MTISMLAAAYLFFGGAGAGTLFFAALADELRLSRRPIAPGPSYPDGLLSRRGYGLALVLLLTGMVCLVFDLGRPRAALLVLLHPTGSYLTVGAYLLLASVAAAASLLLAGWFARRGTAATWCRAIRWVSVPCALAVTVYSGLLLSELRPIPLWNSGWLPPLFLVSSLAAGAACMVLCAATPDRSSRVRGAFERRYALLDLVLVLGEAALCAALLVSVSGNALADRGIMALLGDGTAQALFCGGFAVCGILVPLVGDVWALLRRSGIYATWMVAAFGLVGCCCLRLALVAAGIHVGA